MLAQPPATALPPTGRRKSIRPISMEGSMTDTSSLTRNTASNSKYLQDVSQKRRSSWAPSSVPAIEKKPSLESPELTHSIAPKQQSIEALHHHECDQLRRHICAGCDRNVIVNTDIQSSTAHKQKKESANSNNSSTTTTTTTATDDHPSSPIPTSTKEKLIQEEDEEERWKQSFLKQQEKILRTLLSNHHHINDYELMKLQSQVLQLKNHTNTTMDHILDMQTNILTKLTLVLNDPSPSQPPNAPASPLQEKAPDWQTKLEYDLARFKWSLNQWFGNIVGTGSIENKDYNRFGYTENVVISGICVTTEPGLLPKKFKKYFYYSKPDIICLKYSFTLNRTLRHSPHFRIKEQKEWIPDTDQCEFSFYMDDEYKNRQVQKRCQVEFGLFQRRHHCRSSNQMALFFSKNGQERGEWCRVCDGCFYERMNPYLTLS
ncbi:hypothetical protein BCV71DRAFT_184085 [Rhizopus microsporus]|uniref:FYVE zinc finger domain-containing protein n=1 Tax=Rhizopus microsporus TaxID=58291 RepID=A0A1X0RW28_RHIZD|nr:hypothetical protein BCV71DRAFT_184085 [Rhizopus microsporus]